MIGETVTPRVFVHPDGRMDRKNAAIYLGFAPNTLADWATKAIGPHYAAVGGRVFYFLTHDSFMLFIELRSNRVDLAGS